VITCFQFLLSTLAFKFYLRRFITETEDVSYVSSPYLPFTLRDLKCPLASNAHRASEARAYTRPLFRLNVSTFFGIGGAVGVCLGGV